MLACTRIGATHTVVFGGFSAEALRDRINDCGAKLCITADGGWRRGKAVPLKANVDQALADTPTIEACVVVRRTGEAVDHAGGPRSLVGRPDEDRLVRLPARPASPPSIRCSSSTPRGRPGSRRGSCTRPAAISSGAHLTTKVVFDLREDDIFWCTADIGWVTGHSYVVYGPLSNGATTVLYEGAPDHPEKDRFWSIIERRKVSIFYTAPTAIRAFVRWGDHLPKGHDLSSLRLLGSVGEPINPEAWMWYHEVIGGGRCPIVDTWWQTETGAIMMTPLPGITATKPGSCARPFFGVEPAVVKKDGTPCAPERGRVPDPQEAVAVDAARDPRQPRALREGLLVRDPRRLLHRRRLAPGRGRILLGHGARRRRAQRRRPPPRHRGDRERDRVVPRRRRGRRRRAPPRAEGAGDLRLRDPQVRRGPDRRDPEAASPITSSRRSARSLVRTRSASRTRCRRPAPARSCAACSRSSRPAASPRGTPPRSRTSGC